MKHIQIQFSGYGHWKISTTIRGKERQTITTNSIAIDNYKSDMLDRERGAMGQTKKQAAKCLYNEIDGKLRKQKNPRQQTARTCIERPKRTQGFTGKLHFTGTQQAYFTKLTFTKFIF